MGSPYSHCWVRLEIWFSSSGLPSVPKSQWKLVYRVQICFITLQCSAIFFILSLSLHFVFIQNAAQPIEEESTFIPPADPMEMNRLLMDKYNRKLQLQFQAPMFRKWTEFDLDENLIVAKYFEINLDRVWDLGVEFKYTDYKLCVERRSVHKTNLLANPKNIRYVREYIPKLQNSSATKYISNNFKTQIPRDGAEHLIKRSSLTHTLPKAQQS